MSLIDLVAKQRGYFQKHWGFDSGQAMSATILTAMSYGGAGDPLWGLVTGLLFGLIAISVAGMQKWVGVIIFLLVTLSIILIPQTLVWAALIGSTAYMIPKEIGDAAKKKSFTLDNASDAASYQISWPLIAFLSGSLWLGALVTVLMGGTYIGLVLLKQRGYNDSN